MLSCVAVNDRTVAARGVNGDVVIHLPPGTYQFTATGDESPNDLRLTVEARTYYFLRLRVDRGRVRPRFDLERLGEGYAPHVLWSLRQVSPTSDDSGFSRGVGLFCRFRSSEQGSPLRGLGMALHQETC